MGDLAVGADIKAPDFDPLATVAKVQGAQQGMLQNRLLGLNLQGKQALGSIIGKNTDPTTGETNWQGVSGDASQDPNAAIMLPEIQQQVLARQLTQVQLQREQLGLTGDQWKVVGNAATELLSRKNKDGTPADLTPSDVISTVTQDANYRGLLSDPNFVTRMAALQQDLNARGGDPQAVRAALKGISLMANPTAEQLGLLNGAPSTVDTGSQVIQQQVSPLTGGITVNGVVDKTRGPSEKAAMVQVWNPTTKQYDLKPSGSVVGDMAPGAVPGQPASGATPTQTLAAGPALGETATAEGGVQQALALQQRAQIAPDRIAALKNIGDTLADFTPGPNSQLTYKGTSHLVQLADQFGIPVGDSIRKGVASREEANKLFAQVALQQWSAMGGSGSNDQLAASMKSNPSETISTLGMKNLVALLQGNEQAIGSQFQAWKKYSSVHGAGSYGDFLAGWNSHYDPRAFQYENMAPAAQKAMLAKIGAPDSDARKAFNRSLSFADQVSKLGQ